jgi:23S rRNA (uracil-5-)-methyltransferase RumA
VLCAGLYATGSHEVVEIEECAIQAPALTALAQRFVAILRARGASPYDERRRRGWLRAVHARIAAGSNELIAGLVTTDDSVPLRATLVPQLVAACRDLPGWELGAPPPHLVGLVQNVHAKPGNYLLGPTTQALFGRDHLLDVQDGLTFRIGFTSFYQVHRDAAALLYRPSLALLGDVAGLRVVDGYGGVGAFALRLAAAGAARVELVEAGPGACADAAAAAAMNGLSERVAVVCAPFADADLAPRPDLVVLDPPRAGLLAGGVAKLLALAPARVLYASCSAASLARDLGELGDDYAVTAARLCDLFPHTPHDEVVVLLARR